MKNILNIVRNICFVLTILGAAYVIYQEGNVSAAYAAIPCAVSLVCGVLMRRM